MLAIDGVDDVAVGSDCGMWILFLNSEGTVQNSALIWDLGSQNSDGSVYYSGTSSVAFLGDVNGDQIVDIAVGAIDDRDGYFYYHCPSYFILHAPYFLFFEH